MRTNDREEGQENPGQNQKEEKEKERERRTRRGGRDGRQQRMFQGTRQGVEICASHITPRGARKIARQMTGLTSGIHLLQTCSL